MCLFKISHILVFSYMFLNVLFDCLLRVRWFCQRPVCDSSNINTLGNISIFIKWHRVPEHDVSNDDASFCDICCRLTRQNLVWGSKLVSRFVYPDFPKRMTVSSKNFQATTILFCNRVDLDIFAFCRRPVCQPKWINTLWTDRHQLQGFLASCFDPELFP